MEVGLVSCFAPNSPAVFALFQFSLRVQSPLSTTESSLPPFKARKSPPIWLRKVFLSVLHRIQAELNRSAKEAGNDRYTSSYGVSMFCFGINHAPSLNGVASAG